MTGLTTSPDLFLVAQNLGEDKTSILSLYRALIDGSTAPQPGVTVRDLLGHAEREDDVNVTVTLHPL